MRSLVFLALLLPLVGCAKKTAKVTGKSDDTASAAQQQPAAGKPKVADKPADKVEKKNWVGDPRYPRKDAADPELPPDAPPSGKQPWIGPPPKGGWDGKNPPPAGKLPAEQPKPGPMGVLQPQPVPQPAPMTNPPAAGKRVTKADINDVWIFVENASLASGKMPPPNLIYAALVEAKSPAAELVKDGSIVLTGATQREAIWAFERNAPTQGGWVASQNGPEQLTAAEFVRRAAGR